MTGAVSHAGPGDQNPDLRGYLEGNGQDVRCLARVGLVGLTVLMVPGLSACGGQGEVVQSGDVSVLVSERADG